MTQPKVDNKWVDKRVKEFTDNIKNANILSTFSYDQKNNSINFVLDFRSHLIKLVTQTQQDTLDEVEKETGKVGPILTQRDVVKALTNLKTKRGIK